VTPLGKVYGEYLGRLVVLVVIIFMLLASPLYVVNMGVSITIGIW